MNTKPILNTQTIDAGPKARVVTITQEVAGGVAVCCTAIEVTADAFGFTQFPKSRLTISQASAVARVLLDSEPHQN